MHMLPVLVVLSDPSALDQANLKATRSILKDLLSQIAKRIRGHLNSWT